MLRFQLLLFSVISSLLAVVGVGFISFTLAAQTVVRLNQIQMEQTAVSADKDVHLWFFHIDNEIQRWSDNPILIRATSDTYIGRASRPLASEWLSDQMETHSEYNAIIIADSNRNIIASTPVGRNESEFLSSFPAYLEMSQTDPIHEPGGELYQWHNFSPYFIKIRRLNTPAVNGNYFYIITMLNIDNVLNKVFIPTSQKISDFDVILIDTMTKAPLGYTDLYKQHNNKGPVLSYSRPLSYGAWTVEVRILRKNVLNPAFKLAEKVSLLCFLTLILYIGIKYFFIQRLIFIPVSSLLKTTRSVAENKDFSLRSEYKSTDEIGELASSFNRMLEEIEKRDLNLVQAKNEIAETSDRLAAAKDIAESERKKAEAADIRKTKFLNSLSYRLRSPLNSIMMLVQDIYDSIDSKNYSDEQKKVFAIIHGGIKELSDKINEISNYNEEDADKVIEDNFSEPGQMPMPSVSKQPIGTILLIDDNMRRMFLLSRNLTAQNYRVLPASESSDIISCITEEKPSFIFIGSGLPETEKNEIIKIIDSLTQDGLEDTIVAWLD